MTDKLENDVNRGRRAQVLLQDTLMMEARAHIEEELWRLFKATAPTDVETLQQIKAMQYMHAKYEAFLAKVITDGKKAAFDIEQKKKTLKERFFG